MSSANKNTDQITVIPDLIDFIFEQAKRNDADTFRILDLNRIDKRLDFWRAHLPTVKPFYAVKTNHDHLFVKEMAKLGTGFDCASIREVEQVLALGVDPSRIIFANPFKSLHTINFLREHKVELLVFDCEDELDKLLTHYPSAKLVVRIATDDSFAVVPLSKKFGAPLETAKALIDRAAQKGADIVGISFHVGSNCAHVPSYEKALTDAVEILNYARDRHKMPTDLIDLGGGWPGPNDGAFIEIAKALRDLAEKIVPHDVKLISEPGSFFASQTMTALVRIIGQKQHRENGQLVQDIYLATGVYGLFFGGLYLKQNATALARHGWQFCALTSPTTETMPTTLWGPTCDSIDKIVENIQLPKLETGSWIYSHNVGSYTYVMETNFNQIDLSVPIYVRVDGKK